MLVDPLNNISIHLVTEKYDIRLQYARARRAVRKSHQANLIAFNIGIAVWCQLRARAEERVVFL